jgi:hypothetical protein
MHGPSATAIVALAFALTAAASAQAQSSPARGGSSAAPPPASAEPPAPQPYAPPPAYPVPYPAPYATQPPGPPPGPPPYGPPPAAIYEMTSKSAGLAFVIEFFLPGGGSIYGDHWTGALLTWGLMVGGMVLALESIQTTRDSYTGEYRTDTNDVELAAGVLLLLGGRTYGLVDSIVATRGYNERLRRQLGLAACLSLDRIPTANGGHLLAPALRLSF